MRKSSMVSHVRSSDQACDDTLVYKQERCSVLPLLEEWSDGTSCRSELHQNKIYRFPDVEWRTSTLGRKTSRTRFTALHMLSTKVDMYTLWQNWLGRCTDSNMSWMAVVYGQTIGPNSCELCMITIFFLYASLLVWTIASHYCVSCIVLSLRSFETNISFGTNMRCILIHGLQMQNWGHWRHCNYEIWCLITIFFLLGFLSVLTIVTQGCLALLCSLRSFEGNMPLGTQYIFIYWREIQYWCCCGRHYHEIRSLHNLIQWWFMYILHMVNAKHLEKADELF